MIDAREVFISRVKHKTFVEVNEGGTRRPRRQRGDQPDDAP